MSSSMIVDLARTPNRALVGAKAESLGLLHRRGFLIPPGCCLTFDAWDSYRRNEPNILPRLRTELADRIDPAVPYAVRSSASVEDGAIHSYAGQFATVLDVRGLDDILSAITAVWDSARSDSVQSYHQQTKGQSQPIPVGVIVQRMITPVYSGVAFSRNPMTGLNEVVVEVIEGRGDALVQQGLTPHRWVNKWGGWTTRPQIEAIPEAIIQQVVDGTRAIEQRFGTPVDLEWVYDGTRVHWLQMRRITALGNVSIYSERMAREMLPGLIKPLIWSINIPLVNGAWVRILTELIGKNSLDPNTLARQFYYRAYFNMGAFGDIFEILGMPRDSLELLMGIVVEGAQKPRFKPSMRTLRHVPRILRFAWHAWHLHPDIERFVEEARRAYEPYRQMRSDALTSEQILTAIDELFALNQRTAYFNILAPLMMQMYHRAFKGLLNKAGVDYEQFDLTRGLAGIEEYEPNAAIAHAHEGFDALPESVRAAVRQRSFEEFLQLEGCDAFRATVQRFIQRYGHLSNIGVDFSAVPWHETPDLVLRMITTFTPRPTAGGKTITFEQLPFTGLRRQWAKVLYRRARRYLLYRAQVGELYTIGYGLFRPFFLALADRFLRDGIINTRDDLFMLTHQEIAELARGMSLPGPASPLAVRRREEMEQHRDAVVPETIYGEIAPPLKQHDTESLKGIPTSRGYASGPARIIRGMQEHGKLQAGDVLVIPFSDVGLTPLFARASAVVAESGGILSHSSIIAREYGIPAVVSVPGACRMKDGTLIAVDGFAGEIRMIKNEEETNQSDPIQQQHT